MGLMIKNLPFFNVGANSVASLELDRGMTYNRIVLQLGGTTFPKTDIDRIVCKLNGKIFYDVTGSRLDSINKYRGLADDASYLTVDFSEPTAKTVGGELIGGIGTAEGVSSFTMEVTIGGATAPTLQSWAIIGPPRPLGRVLAMVHHPVTFSAGGKFPVVLPHGPEAGHLIKRVHFFHSNMTSLEVKKNGLLIGEELDSAVVEFVQAEYGRAPQSGLYVYDPVVSGNQRDAVVTGNARSMSFNVTVSASDTVDVYGEFLADLARL